MRVPFIAAILLGIGGTAHAAPLSLSFDLTVVGVGSTLDPSGIPDVLAGLSAGQTITGQMTIDMPKTGGAPGTGASSTFESFTLTVPAGTLLDLSDTPTTNQVRQLTGKGGLADGELEIAQDPSGLANGTRYFTESLRFQSLDIGTSIGIFDPATAAEVLNGAEVGYLYLARIADGTAFGPAEGTRSMNLTVSNARVTSAVPLPAALWMLGAGLGGLLLVGRRLGRGDPQAA